MTAESWKRVETLFEEALGRPAGGRQAVSSIQSVTTNCDVKWSPCSTPTTRRRLIWTEPDNFFSCESLRQSGFLPGQVIDRYRIIREIGRGGMGAVFLAERADDEYQHQVAIKLIKRGTDTDSVLRQFRNERQILAGFSHPNIARLLDGGTTESGLPYFVMEYVDGVSIDEYCKQHALSVRERLKLFREICAAVSYAHGRLVVHRDIKRSNILVTNDGTPKLLDFGIAKILQEGNEPPQIATATGARLMTPEYASPEQLRGEPVTTVSDVYSLGIVLYELLTGQSPYASKASTPGDFAKVANELQPRKPSTAAGDRSRQQSVISNPRVLKGDLDNIVLMALRKEPQRRYQSVDRLSEDIRRHLDQLPVLARKDTFGYRSSKFVRRNRPAWQRPRLCSSVLVAASWLHIAKRHELRRRFNDVRKLANNVLFDYHDAIKELPGATKVRERLVKDALSYLDSLAAEAYGDPELQRELAAAYERVGDVRGGSSGGSLGDRMGALESYSTALRIREALFAAKPADRAARRGLANSNKKIGQILLDTKKPGDGVDHLRKALALDLEAVREQPGDDDLQLDLADIHTKLGRGILQRDDLDEAIKHFRAALAIVEPLSSKHPEETGYPREIWSALQGISDALFLKNDLAGAFETSKKALAVGETLVADGSHKCRPAPRSDQQL